MGMTMNIKFQTFTNLCMSNLEFDTPAEFMELFKQSFEYITEGEDLDEDTKGDSGSVVNLVN